MTSLDIYNKSLPAAAELANFIISKQYSPEVLVGALLVNITNVMHGGSPVTEELLKDLIHDFVAIRNHLSDQS